MLMKNITVKCLQAIESLKDVPDDELQWFIDCGKVIELPAGDAIFRPGDLLPGPFVVVTGKVKLCIPVGSEMQEVGIYESGAVGGNLPFSRAKIANVLPQALEDLTYLQFPLELLDEMIRLHFRLTQALVHVMANRIREYTAFEQQNEKMMALGKLSAGLAHELNNPAAAVVRGSVSLLEHLKLVPDAFKEVISLGLKAEDISFFLDKLISVPPDEKPVLSMMDRSELEDDLADWLAEKRVPCAADLTENLVELGVGTSDLNDIAARLPAASIPTMFRWINSQLATEKISVDLKEASGRIADLVGAVKSFTHMDQGRGKQYVDIHTGIQSTLKMLQHKIRNGNVQIVENFDLDLPEVNAMIGELNQVWTNLVDNALDAMEPNGNGKLTISTGRAKDCVRVIISDNGPGIPENIKTRIFDPFFTTKEIGKGTGLGLDVVMRIVKQHKGAVKVQSRPGQTDLIVEFPING